MGAVKDQESTAPLQFLILLVAGFLQRRQKMAIDYLLAENRVPRERLGPKRLRFTNAERRLLAGKGKRVGRRLLEEIATLASPETLLRWYRRLVAAKYDGSANSSKKGACGKRSDATTQLMTMARENPGWGYTRLRGALKNVGFELVRSTIARVLKEHGIEPAPRRGRSMSWKTFLAGPLGGDRRRRLLQRRGGHEPRPGAVLRAVRHEAQDPSGVHRGDFAGPR